MNKLVKICVSLIILTIVTVVYFQYRLPGVEEGHEGLYSTNDGVMYAETRALAEEGQSDMTAFTRFATGDTSAVGGRHYPNKPIGTSLAAVPFYYLGLGISEYVLPKTNKIMGGQFKTGNVATTPFRQDSASANFAAYAGSFIATGESLAKVQILVSKKGDPWTNLTLGIVKDDEGKPGTDEIGDGWVQEFQTRATWRYLTVPCSAKLEVGQKYWLVIKPSSQPVNVDGGYNLMRNNAANPAIGPAEGSMKMNPGDDWFSVKEAPFFKLYADQPVPLTPTVADYEKDRVTIFATSLLATLAAILAVFLIFLILSAIFKLSFYSSWLAALIFAFGTVNWKYSGVLFCHTFSACLVLAALYLFFSITILKKEQTARLLSLGLILGFAVFTDYPNISFVAGVLVCLCIHYFWKKPLGRNLKNIGLVIGGLLPAVAGIMFYHHRAFGSILATSYKYYTDLPVFLDRALWFSQRHLTKFLQLIFCEPSTDQGAEIYGLLYCAPFLIFALAGLYLLYKKYRPGALLILMTVLALITFVLFLDCVYGGGTHDYRYLLNAVALLMIPLGFFIEKFLFRAANQPTDVLLRFLFWGTVIFAVLIHFALITSLQAHTELIDYFWKFWR